MRRDTQLKTVTGDSVHVDDSYVWAEISYLDSPIDYREFLPAVAQPHTRRDLVLLDDEPVIHLWKKWTKLRALLTFVLQSWRDNCSKQTRSLMNIFMWIMFGLTAGAIAKVLMPGKDPGGGILTIIPGIAGALVGAWITEALWGGAGLTGFDARSGGAAILGSLILLGIYRVFRWRSSARVRHV